MSSHWLYDDGGRVLTPGAFKFVLSLELKRAERSQDFLTLVTIEADREWNGMLLPGDKVTVREIAEVISREVRSTDLIGRTDERTLVLMLFGADVEQSIPIIHRFVSRIENYAFFIAVRIAVGAACCPTDAVDADTLTCRALSRSTVNCRGGGHTGWTAPGQGS
jgi:hypothetical protein